MDSDNLHIFSHARRHRRPLGLLHPTRSSLDSVTPVACQMPCFENGVQYRLRPIGLHHHHWSLPYHLTRCGSLERTYKNWEKDPHLHFDEPRLGSYDLECVEKRLSVWSNVQGSHMWVIHVRWCGSSYVLTSLQMMQSLYRSWRFLSWVLGSLLHVYLLACLFSLFERRRTVRGIHCLKRIIRRLSTKDPI